MNNRQELFIVEYLKDFNATQAAIRAGYSPQSARAVASRLLTNANIKTAIEKKSDKIIDKKEDIIKKNVDMLERIRDNEEEETKDRLKSIELLGKYASMFTDKVAITGEGGGPLDIKVSFVRPKDND